MEQFDDMTAMWRTGLQLPDILRVNMKRNGNMIIHLHMLFINRKIHIGKPIQI